MKIFYKGVRYALPYACWVCRVYITVTIHMFVCIAWFEIALRFFFAREKLKKFAIAVKTKF